MFDKRRRSVGRPRKMGNERAQLVAPQCVGVDCLVRRRSLITLLQLLHNGEWFQNAEYA